MQESPSRPVLTVSMSSWAPASSSASSHHGKDMTYITKTAIEVIQFVKSKVIEIRFSNTKTPSVPTIVDLLSIYQAVDKVGVNVSVLPTLSCRSPKTGLRSRPHSPWWSSVVTSSATSTTTLVALLPTLTPLSRPVPPTLTPPFRYR